MTRAGELEPTCIIVAANGDGAGLSTALEITQAAPDTRLVLVVTARKLLPPPGVLDALAQGAAQLVVRSGARGRRMELSERVELFETIHEVCRAPVASNQAPEPEPEPLLPASTTAQRESRPFEILVIGSSTGGPEALATVLSGLPADLAVPVVIAQHMPPGFTP